MMFALQLLVGLVSAYRYEGPRVNEEVARAEAKALGAAVKSAGGRLAENDDVVRILSTRSKPHLVETFRYYKEIHGRRIEEDLSHGKEETLLEAVLCLAAPAKYFSQVYMRTTIGSLKLMIRGRRIDGKLKLNME
jgi:annexin D